MKTLILSVIFTLTTFFVNSQDKKINWMSWQEAIKARELFIKENKTAIDAREILPKKFFIDIYTDWCGWCKKMDASTFIDPMVVDYMNANYYAIKMDAEMKDTITYNNFTFTNPNPSVSRSTHTLPASLLDSKLSYPTYVLMDENISRIMIFPGYKTAEDLIGILVFFKTNQYLHYKNYLESQPKSN